MTDFDPAKHKMVAVNVDANDVDFGQHFHLSLPDLHQEIREIEAPVPVPAEPSQVTFLTRQLATLREEVAALKDRPHLSKQDIDDLSRALNTRVEDRIAEGVSRETAPVKEEVSRLVERMKDLTELVGSSGGGAVSVSVSERAEADLAAEFADVTATVMKMLSLLQSENQEIKRRVNRMEADALDFRDELHAWVRSQRASA